jgi:hypothetical protein
MKKAHSFCKIFFIVAAIVFVLPQMAGSGVNPPSVGLYEKLSGPSLHGSLIAVWELEYIIPGNGKPYGTLNMFLRIFDKLYVAELDETDLCFVYENASPEGVVNNFDLFDLDKIAEDFNKGVGRAVIFSPEKDVSNFVFTDFCESSTPCPVEGCFLCPDAPNFYVRTCDSIPRFNYIAHCDVRVSFIIPK